MKSNNKKKTLKAGQAGNGTKPHVRRRAVKFKTMERNKVFEIIDAERKHQLKFEDTEGSHIVSSLNMGGILTAIQYNLAKAQAKWYAEKAPYPETSDLLRKIAALCVKAGEDYGMSER